MAVFETLTLVILFFVISLLFLNTFLHGRVSQSMTHLRLPDWYHSYKGEVPGSITNWLGDWFIGAMWTIIFVLVTVSVYLFYKSAFDTIGAGAEIDAFTLLLFFNVIFNKNWYSVFFDMGSPGWAMLLLVLTFLTAIGMLVILGIESKWLEFGLFIIYPLWLVYAGYLNAVWWYLFKKYDIYRQVNDDGYNATTKKGIRGNKRRGANV